MLIVKAGIVLALALFAGPISARAQTEFTFTSWIPWTHPLNEALYIPWAKAVEEASNGEITIRLLPKSVASPAATLDAVRTGQADVGFATHSYSPELFTVYRFTDFPLLGDEAATTSVALQRTHDKFFADLNLYEGVHLIGLNTLGAALFEHRSRLVKSPDDMVGQKFRSGGEILTRIVERLGGVAVAQPITKAYELLSTGVVDGHLGRWIEVDSFKLGEVAPFITTVSGGLGNNSNFLMISKAKYDSLAPAGKAAFDKYSGEVFARMAGEAWDKLGRNSREAAVGAGLTIGETGPETVAALGQLKDRLEAEYVELVARHGLNGADVLAYFHGEVERERSK